MVVAAIAACGGGAVDTTPLAAPPSQTVTTSISTNTTLPPASAGGVTSGVTFPPTSGATSITETVSVHTFGGAPVLSVGRAVQSTGRSPLAATAPFPVLYIEFVSSSNVTIDGTPGVTFTLPSIAAGTTYFLASYGGSGWTYPVGNAGIVSGSTVSFPLSTTNGDLTISPTAPIMIALYSITGPALSPTTLTFGAGNPTSAPFTVTEPGATAAFTAAINCTVASPVPSPSPSNLPAAEARVQTVQPTPTPSPEATFVAQLGATSATPTSGVASFTVTSGSYPGTCSVVVTDAQSASSTETVNVDATSLGVFSVQRPAAQGVH
jgi:hypothetical protein